MKAEMPTPQKRSRWPDGRILAMVVIVNVLAAIAMATNSLPPTVMGVMVACLVGTGYIMAELDILVKKANSLGDTVDTITKTMIEGLKNDMPRPTISGFPSSAGKPAAKRLEKDKGQDFHGFPE